MRLELARAQALEGLRVAGSEDEAASLFEQAALEVVGSRAANPALDLVIRALKPTRTSTHLFGLL
jgi:hypothetical protein